MIESGMDIDVMDCHGCTALHVATLYGRLESVKLLIDAGADLSKMSNDEETALQIAELHNHRTNCIIIAEMLRKAMKN
jgi:ankyrin repeat protein